VSIELTQTGCELAATEGESFFIARNPAMQRVRAKLELLAKVDVPILIWGESGCGRETVARLTHQLSKRAGNSFVKLDCAALDSHTPEQELFGASRSSFSEGHRPSHHGGTILLQEITNLHPRMQARLLELLQDRQFGDDTEARLDVRILASTSTEELGVVQKCLREELYDRLSAFTIRIPPLRERRDEILLLLGYFMRRMARRYHIAPRTFSDPLLWAIERHSWPGNLRELEIFVQRYLVMGDERLALGEFASKVVDENEISKASVSAGHDSGGLKKLVRSMKGETERTAIADVLEKTRWNRKEAARFLGISYRGLLYKIQQYQLLPRETHPFAFPSSLGSKRNGHGQ
jgi:two-component system response regulator AtoC